jgi:DNA-binding NarL/FixJ family response regulator
MARIAGLNDTQTWVGHGSPGPAPRELEVLKEMAEGKTNAAIGESLHLSESAIEKYVNAIFAKLGLSEERKISRRVVAVLTYLRDLDQRG